MKEETQRKEESAPIEGKAENDSGCGDRYHSSNTTGVLARPGDSTNY